MHIVFCLGKRLCKYMNPFLILIPIFMFVFIFLINQYSAIEIIIFLLFITVVVGIGTQYFFEVNLTTSIGNLFSNPEVDVSIVQPSKSSNKSHNKEQTYHVQGKYDYMNAKAICKAYNGKIATIQQVTDAHASGAEWCDYGWSADKMALYPTQLSSWKSYQELEDKEVCGRPGVNGGYNHRLLQQLGVNCFGKKPDIKGTMPVNPISQPSIDKRVQYWQSKIPSLTVSPFNYNEWSE